MKRVFDTCVFIACKPALSPGSLVSIVVIQELLAGARDRSEIREWEAVARKFDREGRLLVPTKDDWLLAGRVLHSLLHGLKSKRTGLTPKLQPSEKQRIVRDVLIARSVRRVNGLLVTDNLADFKQIKRFCNVRVPSGRDFLHL